MNAPQNSTRVMPDAARGEQKISDLHGNQQAGELNLNFRPIRARSLVNGLPNHTSAGGYGAPLAGVRTLRAADATDADADAVELKIRTRVGTVVLHRALTAAHPGTDRSTFVSGAGLAV